MIPTLPTPNDAFKCQAFKPEASDAGETQETARDYAVVPALHAQPQTQQPAAQPQTKASPGDTIADLRATLEAARITLRANSAMGSNDRWHQSDVTDTISPVTSPPRCNTSSDSEEEYEYKRIKDRETRQVCKDMDGQAKLLGERMARLPRGRAYGQLHETLQRAINAHNSISSFLAASGLDGSTSKELAAPSYELFGGLMQEAENIRASSKRRRLESVR